MKRLLLTIAMMTMGFANLISCTTSDTSKKSTISEKTEQSTTSNVIMIYSDSDKGLEVWTQAIEQVCGGQMILGDFGGNDARTQEAIDFFKKDNRLAEIRPKALFLQVGCQGEADPDMNYDAVLFNYPSGKICTVTGKMARNKRLAVSKPDAEVVPYNFAGSLYLLMKTIRKASPETRVFLLPSPDADSKKLAQLKSVANKLCLPLLESTEELADFRFFWENEKPQLGKMLILGDSYSEQRRWINCLETMADVEVVNLGVTSATIRDHNGDRGKYPYTDNPKHGDAEKNHNTLSSQIEKLKRLMKGEKLYEGEQPLTGYIPDIIIIEGGGNDNPDRAEEMRNYAENIRSDRRTTFAGALAYLTKTLHGMFPDAKIYITTTCGLYYGHTDQPFDFIKKSDQQRMSAQMLGYPTINWDLDGRLSFVFNNSAGTGDGSEARPFHYNIETNETIDLLHPNNFGAQFLAESAIRWILHTTTH